MTELGREADVIVIGGGLAGLAATHRLVANGLSVTLIEKCERLGGSSAIQSSRIGGRSRRYDRPGLTRAIGWLRTPPRASRPSAGAFTGIS